MASSSSSRSYPASTPSLIGTVGIVVAPAASTRLAAIASVVLPVSPSCVADDYANLTMLTGKVRVTNLYPNLLTPYDTGESNLLYFNNLKGCYCAVLSTISIPTTLPLCNIACPHIDFISF
mmetsp:Transcript_21613/g.32726  ORF Transcript_21613/g.32726 Transcript_21613/m.32726 type:complete len:121 (-) Transcript_21613:379-741(-)